MDFSVSYRAFAENVKAGVRATSDPEPDDTVKAIGWGKAGSQMEAFKTLHEVEIKVHKTEKPKVKLSKTDSARISLIRNTQVNTLSKVIS